MSNWRLVDDHGLAVGLEACMNAAAVATVQVMRFERMGSFRGSTVSSSVAELTAEARREHDELGRDFWEAVLSRLGRLERADREEVLKGALRHGEPAYERTELEVADFLSNLSSGRYAALPDRTVVALSSRVTLQEQTGMWHLPFIDFSLPASPANDALMLQVVEAIGLNGSVFRSGRSYHYYGALAVSGDEWVRLLARAQLLAPITDRRWVSHQLLDGESSLRVSTDTERHERAHRLVASSL